MTDTPQQPGEPPVAPEDPAELSREALEQHARALFTVLQIAEQVSQSTTTADLLERAVDAVVAFTRFPCCGLYRLSPDGTELALVASRNISAELLERARRLPVEGSLSGVAIRGRALVTSRDVAEDGRIEPGVQRQLVDEGYVEVASVPLLFQGATLGVLNLIYRDPDPLTAFERENLLGIGRTIAMAWGNLTALEERRQLEDRARRNEQIEQLGLLAGGIAHDFNNMLTGVMGNLSLTADCVRAGAPAAGILELLDEAERASRRAAALVRQLLTFSKGGAPVLRATEGLGALVRECAEFAVHGSDVRLELEIEEGIPTFALDPVQISQTVQNLVINAVQASQPGGVVQVRVGQHHRPSGGDWVRISVTDQGFGIPPELRERIFDPYFTTKPTGSGLGLPTVRSIVTRHGGTVEVVSRVGAGTTFHVDLPVRPVSPDLAPPPGASPGTMMGGRALVLDDDPAIRQLAARALRRSGYEVVTVEEGAAAVKACRVSRDSGAPFDVVLLDLTIAGGQGGEASLEAIRALIPGVAAVVSSGYSREGAVARYREVGFDGVLEKPYTVAELIQAVAAARAQRAAAS